MERLGNREEVDEAALEGEVKVMCDRGNGKFRCGGKK